MSLSIWVCRHGVTAKPQDSILRKPQISTFSRYRDNDPEIAAACADNNIIPIICSKI